MAKIKLPSYIKEGHGRMEDAVIITRKGSSFMTTYRTYDRGCTPEQVEIRNAFRTVVADWKYLGGIIQAAWSKTVEDTPRTGYNAFLGANVQHRRTGEPLELCPGMGEELLVNFTAEAGSASGQVVCSFLAAEKGTCITFFTRMETAPGEKSVIARHDAGVDPVSPFTIGGLQAGARYSVYAVVTDAEYQNAQTVSQSVAAVTGAGA